MAIPGVLFESRSMRGLVGALDALVQRQLAITDNIANADTPGFQAKDVEFQAHLDALVGRTTGMSLRRTDDAHFANRDAVRLVAVDAGHFRTASTSEQPQVTLSDVATTMNDGNSINVEGEMVELAETQLAFATAARLLSGRMETLRALAREGR